MRLDQDLERLMERVDELQLEDGKQRLSGHQRELLAESMQHTQRHRSSTGHSATPRRREIDFFLICMGYGLLAFAILVMLRFSSDAAIGAPGLFGLAFLAGASGAAFRLHFVYRDLKLLRGRLLWAAGITLAASLAALISAHAIGTVLGLAAGALFVHVLLRQRLAARREAGQPSEAG